MVPLMRRPLAALLGARLLLPAVGEVHCGGHAAAACADCPQGNGRDWCNGDCRWWGDACHPRGDFTDGRKDFPYPPDVRPEGCKGAPLPRNFSDHKVSVVLPWLGESWEHLSGTLKAMLHFTADELVEEYLFISDGNPDSMEAQLKALSPKVKVIALPQREGLIRAKMRGVDEAKGPVIVFMEGHCIVNQGWLEPLLERVVLHPRVLAMPALDIIPADSWGTYHKGTSGHWRYEWNFNLVYTNPGGAIEETAEPHMSPGTSGGIFAMRKDWFQDLHLFDPGMEQWGGDHFELTMKVWRCGGIIEIVPCSRIGHLFREPVHRPYDVEIPKVVRNYARLARIWTKDHLEYFYKVKAEARSMRIEGMDALEAIHDKLVRELQCKDMQWYLDHVDVEMAFEKEKICVPGATGHPDGCLHPAAQGRSCLDDSGVMTREQFLEARRVADATGELPQRKARSAEL